MVTTAEPSAETLDRMCWYAAHTMANHEKEVLRRLCGREVTAFLPLCLERKCWNKVWVELHRPLFPGYLFVKIPLRERNRVLTVPGVAQIVGGVTHPSPISEREIHALMSADAEKAYADPYRLLTVGRRVRILVGTFAGLEGFLVRRKAGYRVVVSVPQVGSAFSVEVDAADIEHIREHRAAYSNASRGGMDCSLRHAPHSRGVVS